jgi:hypothetical protein
LVEGVLSGSNERADSVEGDAKICTTIQKVLDEAERVA